MDKHTLSRYEEFDTLDRKSKARLEGDFGVIHDLIRSQYWDSLKEVLVLSSGVHLLDVGCGNGLLLKQVLNECPGVSLCGIDKSEELAARAKELLPDDVKIGRDDAAALSFPDESFDRVLAERLLLHLKPAVCEAALAEFVRVLRPGGICAVVDPHIETLEFEHPDHQMTKRILEGYQNCFQNPHFAGENAKTAFERLGLSSVEVRDVKVVQTVASSKRVFSHMRTSAAKGSLVIEGIVPEETQAAAEAWIAHFESQADNAPIGSSSYFITSGCK